MSRHNDAAARAASTTYRAEPFTEEELAAHVDPEARFTLTAKSRAHLAARDLDRELARARGRR